MDPLAFSRYRWMGVCSDYTEKFPCTCSIIPLIGNLVTKLYKLFVDLILANDICFTPYDEHRHTRLLEVICWYLDGRIMDLYICTHIYLSEYCDSSGILKVYLVAPHWMLLPLSSIEMMTRYVWSTMRIWYYSMYVGCQFLIHGVRHRLHPMVL